MWTIKGRVFIIHKTLVPFFQELKNLKHACAMKFFLSTKFQIDILLQHPTYGEKGKFKAKKMEDFVLFCRHFWESDDFGDVEGELTNCNDTK